MPSVRRARALTGGCRNRRLRLDPDKSPAHLKREGLTIADCSEVRYATALSGKWHLSGTLDGSQPTPGDHGFDHWFATQNNALPSHENPRNFVRNGAPVGPLPGYSSTLIVNEAIDWLGRRKVGQPYFLYVALHAPPTGGDADYSSNSMPRWRASEGAIKKKKIFSQRRALDDEVGPFSARSKIGPSQDTFIFFLKRQRPGNLHANRGRERSYGSAGEIAA